MFGNFNTKTLLAAAALALLTAGGAAAAPYDHRDDRGDQHARFDHRGDDRFDHRHPVIAHRPYVERDRIVETLRLHHYRAFGEPYFVRGHYVVRSHDRFGRLVFVQIDPYSGAFLGVIRL